MTKKHVFQPDHAGRHTPMALHPATVVSHNSHGLGADQAARHGDRPNIARDVGRGKLVRPVPVAAGMHRVTWSYDDVPTVTTLASIPDASNPAAMDPTRPGKVMRPITVNPGTRSRADDALHGGSTTRDNHAHARRRHAENLELGRRVIAEALRTK